MKVVTEGLNSSQPQFLLRVFIGKVIPSFKSDKYKDCVGKSSDWINLTKYINYPVTYSEDKSMISKLNFTIGELSQELTGYIRMGSKVELYGYYYMPHGTEMRRIFHGTVYRMSLKVTDNGVSTLSIEALQYGYRSVGLQKHYRSIPNEDDLSTWLHGKSSVKLIDVINGIIKDNGFEIGDINLPAKIADTTFTHKKSEFQRGQSDWDFLCSLAKKYGCLCFIQQQEGVDRVYFVDEVKRVAQVYDDIEFRMPTANISLHPLSKGIEGASAFDRIIRDNEIQKFTDKSFNRIRILRDVEVTEDIDQAYSVSRTACFINNKGEIENGVSVAENNQVTFYRLDEDKVRYIRKTNPELANSIEMNPQNFQWKEHPDDPSPETNPRYAAYYYSVVKIVDEQTAVYDQAYQGLTVSASCNMDLNIRSQRVYRINGLMRWSSSSGNGSGHASYFLQGLRHVWDSSGLRTELDFIR